MSKRIGWNVPFDQEFNIGDITWVRSDGLWGLGAQSVNNINNNNTKNVKIIKFMFRQIPILRTPFLISGKFV
jgi:hypothetical protein